MCQVWSLADWAEHGWSLRGEGHFFHGLDALRVLGKIWTRASRCFLDLPTGTAHVDHSSRLHFSSIFIVTLPREAKWT